MALIKFPECGTEVSTQAEKCPKCAYPIAQTQKQDLTHLTTLEKQDLYLKDTFGLSNEDLDRLQKGQYELPSLEK